MARSDSKDPKLSEVKAVLQRLQGFDADPTADDPKPAGAVRRSDRIGVLTGSIILATAAGLLGAAYLFVRDQGPTPEPPGAADGPTARTAGARQPSSKEPEGTVDPQRIDPSAPEVKAVLEGARGLMAKGQVRAAREQLLALAAKGSPDAAWDLARSHDPNVLAALPTADAPPDVQEAARWYRAWYAAAVRDGLVADSVSLERIIGSMRH